VIIGGPLAAYVCYLLSKGHGSVGAKGGVSGKLAFWMIVLATGELYGGKNRKTLKCMLETLMLREVS
jgi:hypothetical protein